MKNVPVLPAGPLAPSNFNAPTQEVKNMVLASGQTLSEADVYQLAKAIADYVANGDFYTGGGSANVYTATTVSPRQGIHELQNGMQVRLVIPATNTGASTLDVNGLGAADVKKWDGSALVACDLVIGEIATFVYNSLNTEWRLVGRSAILSKLPPVGSIVPWNDFNGAVAFDSNYYAHMNDQVFSDANSPLNGKTLTDCSGRYLVGFGSDGGQDIDSVAWSDTPVGNDDHEIDLEHEHGPGTLQFKSLDYQYSGGYGRIRGYDTGGSIVAGLGIAANSVSAGGVSGVGAPEINTSSFIGYTKDGAGTTSTELSSTQSIQPKSIPVRFLCVIK